MTADVLTTITKLIQSPPGQLAAGGVLAGIVWKFFERVEAVLTDDTRLEIALWLLGRKRLSPTFQNWPDTFAKVFDRVFGEKHLSPKCFGRSTLASLVAVVMVVGFHQIRSGGTLGKASSADVLTIPSMLFLCNIVPDYVSLLATRLTLALMKRTSNVWTFCCLVFCDLIITFCLGSIATAYGFSAIYATLFMEPSISRLFAGMLSVKWHIISAAKEAYSLGNGFPWLYPAFFTSIWLWLYAGSGFLLKAARRFDIGFEWFNRKFDIEKKPLQSIGLVAGALVAVVYWAAVIVSRVGE